MGHRLFGLFVVASIAVAAPCATSAEPKDTPLSKPMKVDDLLADMIVVHDTKGHFLAVVDVFKRGMRRWAFYGSQKKLYFQRTRSAGGNKRTGTRYYNFYAPRDKWAGLASKGKGKWLMTCGTRKTTFIEADPALKRALLDKAKFVEQYWKRESYALARDEWGKYYYVDRLRKEWGGKAFRLWVGQRGNMVRQKMTNIVSDSVGDIFATRSGSLRLILNKKDATWVKKTKRSALTFVPIWPNRKMIYAELGVYPGRFGNPCDDM